MSQVLRIRRVQIMPLAIPMRLRFGHAAAARSTADPVIVRLHAEAPYHDDVGSGETLARPYVTGETHETVLEDIQKIFVPLLIGFRARSFGEAVHFADALPTSVEGRLVNAARAAVELAVLDLAGRVFGQRLAGAAACLELSGFCPAGAVSDTRYSGQVIGRRPMKLTALLRAQRCYGLRDFKLKVATEGWRKRLVAAHRVLGGAIASGRATLRVDANGGWSMEEALAAAPELERCGVCAIEQPLKRRADDDLKELDAATSCDLIADESLLTVEDARRLIEQRAIRVFNIRIAKNGGLLPSLRIASEAMRAGLDIQLGCLVGETSLLTAAGLAFLDLCPAVRFAEGAFGSWLLRDELIDRPLQFGRGGRVRRPDGHGIGIEPIAARLERLVGAGAIDLHL